jgi:hypothetical protein
VFYAGFLRGVYGVLAFWILSSTGHTKKKHRTISYNSAGQTLQQVLINQQTETQIAKASHHSASNPEFGVNL